MPEKAQDPYEVEDWLFKNFHALILKNQTILEKKINQ